MHGTFLTTFRTSGLSSSVRYAPTPKFSFKSLVSALKASETPRIGSGGACSTPSSLLALSCLHCLTGLEGPTACTGASSTSPAPTRTKFKAAHIAAHTRGSLCCRPALGPVWIVCDIISANTKERWLRPRSKPGWPRAGLRKDVNWFAWSADVELMRDDRRTKSCEQGLDWIWVRRLGKQCHAHACMLKQEGCERDVIDLLSSAYPGLCILQALKASK